MPKLRHYDDLGTARFVMFSCYRRMPSLTDVRAIHVLLSMLDSVRCRQGFLIHGYVIMPEHVHLVMSLPEELKLGLLIREIKSRMAREYFAACSSAPDGRTRVFWQKRCYDHNCRTTETTRQKIQYCHYNPVKRGLVARPEDWKWSSHNWYQGQMDVPLRVDSLEL